MYIQAVVGAPGSGKSTYCRAMAEYLTAQGRKVMVINLDPANDSLPYECTTSICELVSVDDVMESLCLGPNAALMYCMQYLVDHCEWLKQVLDKLNASNPQTYILLDFPGQIELYTHHTAVKDLMHIMQRDWGHHIVTVHFTDAHYCSDPAKFVSILITALHSMIQLETPHINILSKIDIVQSFGPLPFNLEYFTEVMDLRYIIDLMQDDPFVKKLKNLATSICQVVEDYSLVNFFPLSVNDQDLMLAVAVAADKANGYCFGHLDAQNRINNMVHANDNTKADAVDQAQNDYVN